jgi:serine/threonine-protein kinase ATR
VTEEDVVEALSIIIDTLKQKPQIFSSSAYSNGESESAVSAVVVFVKVFKTTISEFVETRKFAFQAVGQLMQYAAAHDRVGWMSLVLGATRAVEDAREVFVFRERDEDEDDLCNNHRAINEFIVSSFGTIAEHFANVALESRKENFIVTDRNINTNKKLKTMTITGSKKSNSTTNHNHNRTIAITEKEDDINEFLVGLKHAACISLDRRGNSAILFANAALQTVARAVSASPQIASTMITPQTIDAIIDLSSYSKSYEVRLNALKCAKAIDADFSNNVGRADFAIQATLNALQYFENDVDHTGNNSEFARICLQTLQQQCGSSTNGEGKKLPSSSSTTSIIVDNAERLVEAFAKSASMCVSRVTREMLLDALLLVASYTEKEEQRMIRQFRKSMRYSSKRRENQRLKQNFVGRLSSNTSIGVLCSRACASLMHCAVTPESSQAFSEILVIAMRAPTMHTTIRRRRKDKKSAAREFSDEDDDDADFEDLAISSSSDYDLEDDDDGVVLVEDRTTLEVDDEEKQNLLATAKWTESCVISMLEQLGLPRKNTDPDSLNAWISETSTINDSSGELRTLEKIGAIVTLAKASAKCYSADDAQASAEKFVSTWLQWFGKNKNAAATSIPKDSKNSIKNSGTAYTEAVDINAVIVSREKFCAFAMLCDAATALLLAGAKKKRRNEEDKLNRQMDIDANRGGANDDFSLLNVHDVTPEVVLWPFTRYGKDAQVCWLLDNASKFTDNSNERQHAKKLLESTIKSKIASVMLATTFIATTEKSSGTIVSAELAKRVLQRAIADEDERVRTIVVMALPFAKFFAQKFSASSQTLGELAKKGIGMVRNFAGNNNNDTTSTSNVTDTGEQTEALAARAITALAIGVNYDLGCLTVALSLSDTLTNTNNSTAPARAKESYEVILERLSKSLTSKAITAIRLAAEKKYEDLETLCESIHVVVNKNLSSASETRRKIANALFSRMTKERGTAGDNLLQNNVFRIATDTADQKKEKASGKPSRGQTSRAKEMNEIEEQKKPLICEELAKLCVQEYGEIFEKLLVCEDCPEVTEIVSKANGSAEKAETARKQRGASWKNNNGARQSEAAAIKLAISSFRRILDTSITCGPDFLDIRNRNGKEAFALFGANELIGYVWRLAHHESSGVRKAVLEAARIFSRREILLESALKSGQINLSAFSFRQFKATIDNLNTLNLRRQSSLNVASLWGGAPTSSHQHQTYDIEIEASLKLLRYLKIVVDEAPTDTARELSLRVFSIAASTVPAKRDALTIEAMFCVKHIVPNAGENLLTASTAALLLHSLAKKRDIRPKELLLGDAQIADGIGQIIPNNKEMLRTLCEAVIECSERELLDALLPAAISTLVRKRDITTLAAYAKEFGGRTTVKSIVNDFAYVVIADFLSSKDNETHRKNAIEFLQEQTECEIQTLIADNALYLVRCLIKSAGANDKIPEPVICAKELKPMLNDIGELALGDAHFTTLPDFLRAHFTAVEMLMYESDEKRNVVTHRRFLKSLTIMVILIQDHLPQFAPKVMAHFSAALERTGLRRDALRAWFIFVQVIAKHSSEYLSRIAGQIVVTLLPYLQNNDQQVEDNSDIDEIYGGDVTKNISVIAATEANLAVAVIDELVLKAVLPKPILASLPLLPRLESLRESNAKLDDARKSNLLEDSLEMRLQALTNSLSQNESAAVRETALAEIYRALSDRANANELNSLVKGSNEGATADPTIGNLGFALLKSFSHDYSSTGSAKNEQARLRSQRLAAKCLGELGAIDPGRLGLTTESVDLHLAVSPQEIAQTLLVNHLSRMVRGATDAHMLDATAFSAQKVLITSECRPEGINEDDVTAFLYNRRENDMDATLLPEGSTNDGAKFWSELPEEARTTLAPYLTTIYTSNSNKQLPSMRPIYGTSSSVNSFSKWIQQWCRVLAIEARGPCADLFENCLGVFRHDTRLTLFLLPHMVLDALTGQKKTEYASTNVNNPIIIDNDEGDESARIRRLSVELEILAVLRDAAGIILPDNELQVMNTNRAEISPNDVVAFSAMRSQRGKESALGGNTSASGGSGGIAELAAQVIFHLLDQLETWVADALISNTRRHPFVSNIVHKNVNFVQEFLENIPKTLLAKAAQNCGASVRALRYFEDHCRAQGAVSNPASANFSKQKLDMADGDVSFLASVYQGLAEPDQLLALPRFRAQPKVEDELLRHEEAGEWEEALIHYESELSKKSTKSSSSDALSPAEWGRLRCLKGLGHLTTVQRDSETLLAARRFARNRKETAALAESGANAAWRLGRWDDLDHLLTKLDNENARSRVSSSSSSNAYETVISGTNGGVPLIGPSRNKRGRSAGLLSSRLHRKHVTVRFNDDDDVSGLPTHLSSSAFNPKAPADGDAAIGRIMLSLTRNHNQREYSNNDSDDICFRRAMKSARDAVLAPLAAAAMEGSWHRAHPSLVRLHLLQECAAGFEAVKSFRMEMKRLHLELLSKNEISGVGGGDSAASARSRLTDTRSTTTNLIRIIPRESKSGIPLVTQASLNAWDARLDRVPATIQTREPILALRRCIYGLLQAAPAKANAWLAQARACRTAGHHGAAQLALLEARNSMKLVESGVSARTMIGNNVRLALEQAKLLWAEGKQHKAVSEIQGALGFNDEGANSSTRSAGSTASITEDILAEGDEDASVLAKATLKLARWAAVTGQKQKNEILDLYKRAKKHYGSREKAHFHLARYLDELLKDAQRREAISGTGSMTGAHASSRGRRTTNAAAGRGNTTAGNSKEASSSYSLIEDAAQAYGASAKHGHRHVYASIPRMLTLWFDAGDAYEKMQETFAATTSEIAKQELQKELQRSKKCCETITLTVRNYSNTFPLYKWLIALPQLTSRLTHKNGDVHNLVQMVIVRLFKAYPDQTLWQLAPMLRSRDERRKLSAVTILQISIRDESSHREQIQAFQHMADYLVKLCAFQPKVPSGADQRSRPAKSFSLEKEFPGLCAMFPSQIMIPLQISLTAALPPKDSNPTDHVPFPGATPSFYGFVDDVQLLQSLQKPKKLTVIGDDGQEYSFLCKPKDDLRKDLRMMEFCAVLNRLLSRDEQSRKRRLYLRTFSVIPLSEDCGIIEWVPNTTGLRHVMQQLYIEEGVFTRHTHNDIKEIYERWKGRPTVGCAKEVLQKFPPIFHKWFLDTWKEPSKWFAARKAFAHTSAVWAMVGHIVGLGDRHAENVLLDATTGDCVHVDFSCLFDKGTELETPEVVPFRLTQNMIDGLGVGGYEGAFERVCEITLDVLRNHREALMSVLETFVHDPLVEWTRGRSQNAQVSERKAKEALENIGARLEGVVVGVGAAPSLPLSTSGQVRRLIEEATSLKNLGSMYLWWFIVY